MATSKQDVSDGEEHTVNVNRFQNDLTIVVDGDSVKEIGSPTSKQLNLGLNPELHLGGIPKDSKYYGYACIKHTF